MTMTVAEVERRRLNRLADELRSEGYSIELEPPTESLPAFLQGFQPDAIARRGDEVLVIEVKVLSPLRRSLDAMAVQAAEMAERVRGQPGWQVRLILADPQREFERTVRADPGGLSDELKRAERLVSLEEPGAALVAAWSAIEAINRELLRGLGESRNRPSPPSSVARDLVSYGFVEDEDLPFLDRLAAQRNAIAHGLAATAPPVNPGEVLTLIALGRELCTELAA